MISFLQHVITTSQHHINVTFSTSRANTIISSHHHSITSYHLYHCNITTAYQHNSTSFHPLHCLYHLCIIIIIIITTTNTTNTTTNNNNNNNTRCCPHQCVRSVRAKHCAVCRRCVCGFDHHCVWIHNCVGCKNRKLFLGFVTMMIATHAICAVVAVKCMHVDVPVMLLFDHCDVIVKRWLLLRKGFIGCISN